MNKKKLIIIISLSILIVLVASALLFLYSVSPVDSKSSETISFKVEKGWGKNKIIEELKNKDLIRNVFITKLILKLDDKELYAGTYKLSKDMSTNEILKAISDQKNIENEAISLTFVEGKRLSSYIDLISENFNLDKDEITKKLSDKEYLDKLIEKYWFLTDEIYNDKIYFPLEGYFFPDTYYFKKNSTIEDIVSVFLDTMGKRLEDYKDILKSSDMSVHEYLTLASIVEQEGVNSDDRGKVAGVFYNRLEINMSLGSDVTTYYAVGKTFKDKLTQNDLDSCNGYNTRGSCVKGLPVGPICSPSLSSLAAVINPDDNDYLYFLADKDKNTYFMKTYSEHQSVKAKLIQEGKWIG